MDRRKFMYGFGGAVIGTGAVLGSGAFTQFQAERTASISIANDSTGYLGLDAEVDAANDDIGQGTITSEYVTMDSNNQLDISLDGTVGDGDGVNDDAVMQIGEITEPDSPDPRDETDDAGDLLGDADEVAFLVYNQFADGQDITLTVDHLDDLGDAVADSVLELPYAVLTGAETIDSEGADFPGSDGTAVTIPADAVAYVVVRVDTETGTDEVANIEFSASAA